jgi:signal transduction histidine kinase
MSSLLDYFDNLRIRTKLLVGYGLVILFLLAFSVAAALWIKRIESGSETVFHEITPIVGALRDLKFSGLQLIEAVDTVIITQGIDAYTAEEDRENVLAVQFEAIERERQEIAGYLRAYEQLTARHEDDGGLRGEILTDGRTLLDAAAEFLKVLRTSPNSLRKLLHADQTIDRTYATFGAKVATALQNEGAELAEEDEAVQSLIQHSFGFIVILTALAIAAALASAHVISNRIARPLLRLRDETTRVGDGEQTTVAPRVGDDEISELARAFAAMTQKMNESTEKRVGILRQVASTVSHELRNPLAAIRTSVAVLRTNDVKQGGRAAPTFERIERTIQRCTRIIMSLVDYTHLDDVDRKAIEIDMWLSDWLDRQPPVDGIALQRDLNSAVILEVDPERLGQALASLMENAVHALTAAHWQPPADRQRQITVRTELADDKVCLSIDDNGCGIPPENLSRIFEPLFTTKNFGVGLGLPLVKQIVEFHGGMIAVTSAPDQGSTFTITLPQRAAGDVTLFDAEPEPILRKRAA